MAMIHELGEKEVAPEPTTGQVRDLIKDRLPTNMDLEGGSGFAKHKSVGTDEIVIFHPTGKKFSVKVTEIEG